MHDTRRVLLGIGAVCAIAGPVILLAVDIIFGASPNEGFSPFLWTVGMWVAFVLLLPAVAGVTYLLGSAGSRLAYPGGVLAFFGAAAGASMQVLFRSHAVLAEAGAVDAITVLRSSFKLVASTQMIGLAWPLGLLLLALASLMTRAVHFSVPIVLAIGAIAFPVGRIAGVYAAVIVSGFAFIFAFGSFAQKMFAMSRNA